MRIEIRAAFLILLVSPCSATDVAFEIDYPAGLARPVTEVTLVAAPTSNVGDRIEKVASIPGSVLLDLEPSQTWLVSVEGANLWSHRQLVVVKPETRVSLPVYPTGVIRGRFRFAGAELPGAARLRFESSPRQGAIAREETECPIGETGEWRCELPAPVPLDLRLSVDGFIALYFWDIRMSTEKPLDLGSVILEKGASVSGSVELGIPTAAEEPIDVELIPFFSHSPSNTGRLEPEQARQARGKVLTSTANIRGFFLFRQVEPGNYLLLARHPEFAPARRGVVRVLPELETQILDPLVLYPPVDLEVFVDPPLDPTGHQWHASIQGLSGEMGPREVDFSEGGYWGMDSLATGHYELVLFDPESHTVWHRETLELGANEPPVQLQVPLILLNGTIKRGPTPLQARIGLYRWKESMVHFYSNERGEFTGYLPGAGEWAISVELARGRKIHLPDILVSPLPGSNEAWVDVEIPDYSVFGKVRNESGETLAGYTVVLTFLQEPGAEEPSEMEGINFSADSDEEGNYEVLGLFEGDYMVFAMKAMGSESRPEYFTLTKKESPLELDIVIPDYREVIGRLLGGAGPLGGASIRTVAGGRSAWSAGIQQVVTSSSGEFRLRAPADIDSITVVVYPPGHAFKALPISLTSRPIVVTVERRGGDLVLDRPDHDPGDPYTGAFKIVYEGTELSLIEILPWLEANGISPSEMDPTSIAIPNVAAGQYAACTLDGSRCNYAYLTEGGNAHLAVPEAGALE